MSLLSMGSYAVVVNNDNFCDNGDDEVQTSACSHRTRVALFKCRNSEFVVQEIFSSRVGDGVCDCCDGSDEDDTISNRGITCPNTCYLIGKALKEKEEQKRLQMQAGKVRKNEILQSTGAILREMRLNHQQASSLIPEHEKNRESLREQISIEEKLEAEELDGNVQASAKLYDEAVLSIFASNSREQRILAIAALTLRGKEEAAEAVLALCSGKYELPGSDPDDTEAIVLAMDAPDDVDGDDLYSPSSESGDISDMVKRDPAVQHAETLDAMINALALHRLTEDSLFLVLSVALGIARSKRVAGLSLRDAGLQLGSEGIKSILDSLPPSPQEIRKNGIVRVELANLRERLREAENHIQSIRKNAADAEKALQMDFGMDDSLSPIYLRRQCYEYSNRQYSYKICPYGEARQHSTLLGTHAGEIVYSDDSRTKIKEIFFQYGERCQGTSDHRERLLKLSLECAHSDKGHAEFGFIEDVQEVEVCVYSAILKTPLAC